MSNQKAHCVHKVGEHFICPCCVKRWCLAVYRHTHTHRSDDQDGSLMTTTPFKLDKALQDIQEVEWQNIGVDAELPHLEANICPLMVSGQSETLWAHELLWWMGTRHEGAGARSRPEPARVNRWGMCGVGRVKVWGGPICHLVCSPGWLMAAAWLWHRQRTRSGTVTFSLFTADQ